jgi:hypothetical protein
MSNATLAIRFNEHPEVIYLMPFNHSGASVVELALMVQHPGTGLPTKVIYRNTSLRGKRIYYYSEGTASGEARGG